MVMTGLISRWGLAKTPGPWRILTFAMSLGLALCPLALSAQSATLVWVPETDPHVTGYIVYSGTNGIDFDKQVDVGTNNPATVTTVTPGATNYFQVVAYDVYYDLSPPSPTVSCFIPNTDFALLLSGNGTIAPSRTLKGLLEGKTYTLTANPAKGFVFGYWTSNEIVISYKPRLTFLVQSNETLKAYFFTNPFLPIAGGYHGLFYVTSNATEDSSGYFTAMVTPAGAYNARLLLGGQHHSATGQFTVTGEATNIIKRPGLTSLAVRLQLDLSNGPVTGTISDGTWTADLLADRAVYSKTNQAPEAGRYTLAISGSSDTPNEPGGNGFGSLVVNELGDVTFSGLLADGTPVTASSIVSGNGHWPFYASLYGGKGSMLGWLSFTNGGISGQMGWFKLSEAAAKLYSGGFTNSPEVVGSAFFDTNGLPILGFTNGLLSLTNGDFEQGITNQIVLVPDKESTDQDGAKLIFNTSSGLFKGSVMNPETSKPIAFNGAVLQNQNIGVGFFLSTNESGSVILSPAR